ncbi:hypothetical protein AaE_004954 [Aphanomyces astaci]|uniref:Palmitoyltransferase n=1 Tax=Aphanomyces astaci TaxID=112090 RepID=A0A6A5ALT3_APHAT|nr:hypothetical protein AaE_004954 [Aphanomyces astaci]
MREHSWQCLCHGADGGTGRGGRRIAQLPADAACSSKSLDVSYIRNVESQWVLQLCHEMKRAFTLFVLPHIMGNTPEFSVRYNFGYSMADAAIVIAVVALVLPLGVVGLVYCVDPNKNGVLSWLRRFVLDTLPSWSSDVLLKVCGPSIHSGVVDAIDYVLNRPNPLMQVVYLHLVIGGYALFIVFGQPLLPNVYLSYNHVYYAGGAALVALVTFLQACTTNAGVVNARDSLVQYHAYEFDQVMYIRGNACKTCHLNKYETIHRTTTTAYTMGNLDQLDPSTAPCAMYACRDSITTAVRTGLGRICKHVVEDVYIHVAWLNGCVGEQNYRILSIWAKSTCLLVQLVAVCLRRYHPALHSLGRGQFCTRVVTLHLFESKYINYDTGAPTDATVWIVARYIIYIHPVVCMLFFMCLVMGAALVAFAGFHLYLVASNRTTNEFFKQWAMAPQVRASAATFYSRSVVDNMVEVLFPKATSVMRPRTKKTN